MINGGTSADFMAGGDGNDTIKRQKGKDTIDGGQGTNTATGGKGDDAFVFRIDQQTTITDFKTGDEIQIDNDFFAPIGAEGGLEAKFFNVGSNAQDGDDFVIYNKNQGKLYLDVDADGAAPQVLLATLKGKPNIDEGDILADVSAIIGSLDIVFGEIDR